MAEHGERDVYFEFTAIGNAVKVTAIDSLTGIEISTMGPSSASQADLQQARPAKTPDAAQARIVWREINILRLCAAVIQALAGFGRYGRADHPWRAAWPRPYPPRKPSRIRCFQPLWPTPIPRSPR
jgi:hypothetical protein